jgi:predicted lipoprotein with Yx(FWY)xxD motif
MSRLTTGVRGMAVMAAVGLALAACSKGSTGSTGAYGSAQSSPKASGGTLSIGTDRAKGVGTVLDTSSGLTLYRNTQESGGKIVCTGGCAQTWPPVTVGGALPAAPTGASGSFGTITRPDGSTQLTFEGMPLYTYAGDTGPGQAAGQGLQGIWFAVGPSGAITSSSGGGNGSSSGGW